MGTSDRIQFFHARHPTLNSVSGPKSPAVALGEHTDSGSVTILFNRLGGLQVRLPPSIAPTPPSSSAPCEGQKGALSARVDVCASTGRALHCQSRRRAGQVLGWEVAE
ncbi:hypothetical protein PMIN06_003409 [Paraphaeosphaeria minitans]